MHTTTFFTKTERSLKDVDGQHRYIEQNYKWLSYQAQCLEWKKKALAKTENTSAHTRLASLFSPIHLSTAASAPLCIMYQKISPSRNINFLVSAVAQGA